MGEEAEARRAEWAAEQERLRAQLVQHDAFDWVLNPGDGESGLRLVGGVDISFVKSSETHACAALVVLEYPSLRVVYSRMKHVRLQLPYISGFLAFREAPFLLDLLAELRTSQPELLPQVLLVDGNGVLHARGFGLASHLGVLAGIPCIGVSKKFYNVAGLTKPVVREQAAAKLAKAGDWMPIADSTGRVWGAAVRSTDFGTSPVYVSIGHMISLETAVALVQTLTRYRVPEPVRQADLMSREWLREHQEEVLAQDK